MDLSSHRLASSASVVIYMYLAFGFDLKYNCSPTSTHPRSLYPTCINLIVYNWKFVLI